ncbi:MAG: caspase family protein [Pseudomonadota bacterium]
MNSVVERLELRLRLSALSFVSIILLGAINAPTFVSSESANYSADRAAGYVGEFGNSSFPATSASFPHEEKVQSLTAGIGQEASLAVIASVDQNHEDDWRFGDLSTPVLRTELGRHASHITGISIGADERTLATSGHDKTIRIWRIADVGADALELLSVLRPPIVKPRGEDARWQTLEGIFFDVALSKDDKYVAACGITGWMISGQPVVYIYNLETEEMDSVLPLSNATSIRECTKLAYTQDNENLLIGTFSGEMLVFANKPGARKYVDKKNIASDGISAVIGIVSHDDKIVVATNNGEIRVFDSDLNELARKSYSDDLRLSDIDLSYDGRFIAASFENEIRIDILKLDNLNGREFDAGEAWLSEFNDIRTIKWSKYRHTLQVAGDFRNELGMQAIREVEFQEVADDPMVYVSIYSDIEIDDNKPIELLRVRKRGDIIFANDAGQPQIVYADAVSAKVKRSVYKSYPSYASANRSAGDLAISDDGEFVSAPVELPYSGRLNISIRNRNVSFTEDFQSKEFFQHGELKTPKIQHDLVSIDDWSENESPTCDGNPFVDSFHTEEEFLSLAFSRSSKGFVLGSERAIRRFSETCEHIWTVPAAARVTQINIADERDIVVAALSDGTIRWYDLDDGEERLAVMSVSSNGNLKWISWTPAGYYDASAGAEDLIGWQINQSARREALFYPASRFRSLFNRPEYVRDSLSDGDDIVEPDRIDLLRVAPPIAKIQSIIPENNGNIRVEYAVTSIFNEPVDIDLFVDGARQPMDDARRDVSPNNTQSFLVNTYGNSADIAIVAISKDGKRSAPDSEGVARGDRIPIRSPTQGKKPKKLNALLIGVSTYTDNTLNLNFAHTDAQDISTILREQNEYYDKINLSILTNEKATRRNIVSAFYDLIGDAGPHDVTIIFFSGHGAKEKSGRRELLYLLPHDTVRDDLLNTAIDQVEIKKFINLIEGKRFVFLDACYSDFEDDPILSLFDGSIAVNSFAASDGFTEVISSSAATQKSYEHHDWKNGAFTEAILELFQSSDPKSMSEADRVTLRGMKYDGAITNDELRYWAGERVEKLVREKLNEPQNPTHHSAHSTKTEIAKVVQ